MARKKDQVINIIFGQRTKPYHVEEIYLHTVTDCALRRAYSQRPETLFQALPGRGRLVSQHRILRSAGSAGVPVDGH